MHFPFSFDTSRWPTIAHSGNQILAFHETIGVLGEEMSAVSIGFRSIRSRVPAGPVFRRVPASTFSVYVESNDQRIRRSSTIHVPHCTLWKTGSLPLSFSTRVAIAFRVFPRCFFHFLNFFHHYYYFILLCVLYYLYYCLYYDIISFFFLLFGKCKYTPLSIDRCRRIWDKGVR